MFWIVRFQRASNWRPETVNESDVAEDARSLAQMEVNRQLGLGNDCALAIVERRATAEKSLVEYCTSGFVPLNIEERIWDAMERPERETVEVDEEPGMGSEIRYAVNPEAAVGCDVLAIARHLAWMARRHCCLAATLDEMASDLRRYSDDALHLRGVRKDPP